MAIITSAELKNMKGFSSPFNKNGSVVTLKKISETDWLLFGDLAEGDSEGFDGDPYFLIDFVQYGDTGTILVNNPESTAQISMGAGAQQTSFIVYTASAPFMVPEGQHLSFLIETSSSYTSDFKATAVYGDGSSEEYELDSSWEVSFYHPSGIQSVLFEPKWPGVTMSGSIRAELVTPPEPQGLAPGDEFEGGYFVGVSSDGNYNLFVSKGEIGSYKFSESDYSPYTSADSETDGYYNTQQILNTSSSYAFPAAQACDEHLSDGFGGWFLPSRYELGLLLDNSSHIPLVLPARAWTSEDRMGERGTTFTFSGTFPGSTGTTYKSNTFPVYAFRRVLR